MDKLSKVFGSFYCAGRGIAFCIRHERHLRIHIVAAAFVMYFSTFYEFSAAEYAVLILTCTAVISAEIMNTSVEVVVDKVSPRYNIYAMIGKDIAAGAVLVTAIGAVAVGVFMFWDAEVFKSILGYFSSKIIRPVVLTAAAVLAIWFIFAAKPRKTARNRKEKVSGK